MATEADIPESISITKIECEDKDQKGAQFDKTVYESCLEELKKVDDGMEKLPGTVENSANADTMKEAAVGAITVNTVFTSDVGTLQGESFFKSPSVAKVDCEENCSLSEHDQTDKIFNRAEGVSEIRNPQQKDQENETGSGENEGMGKTKGIAEKGNDSLDDVNTTGTYSQKTQIEEPAPKVKGESSKEERNVDQHFQIVDDQQTFVEQNPESIKEEITGSKEDKMWETTTEEDTESESTKQFSEDIIEATSSQYKEALYHGLDSAEDRVDKAVTEVCNRESIDKNFSAKTTHIEEELEETNFKVKENESEKPFNTVATEKGSEAVGANENEGKEKRELDQTPCDGFKDDSMSILKPNPDIENDETILEIGEGAKGMDDVPPLTHIEAKTTIKDEIEDKNNLDTPFIQKTEEICCQKVENPVIFEGLSEIGSGDAKKSPQEEHQDEILENISQATANEKFKDDEIDEQKESIMSQIQVQAMTPEASAGEKIIEEKFIVQEEENISNTESVEVEDHLKKEKSEHEVGPEQTFLQHDEPEEEKLERYLDVTSEINDSVASSENVETITHVQDEISKKRLEESLEGMEEKPTNTVEISEPCVPNEKNFPLLDSNEVIERPEVENPKEDEIDFHAKHSILEDTKQVDDEILDKQDSSETVIVSADNTTLEQTFTEGEGMQETISITSNTEVGTLEKIHGLDYTNKPEVEDAKEKVEDDLQKNDVTFDKETHLKCDDTEAGCIAEDTLVMVHDTTGAGEESSEQSSSELNSKNYSYGAEGDVKSNINKAEEVHDGSRIPPPQEVTEEQIIEGSLNYLSPESIKETAKRFHDDGKEAERSKEEDGKDHIVEEGNLIDHLPHSVAESQDFQDGEKEAEQSKGEIIEESEEAQPCKSFVHETNQDNEKDYEGAPSAKQLTRRSITQKNECEDKDQKGEQFDRIVYESCLEELKKVDDGMVKLPGTVENSANADTMEGAAVGTITVNTVFTGDVGTLQGECFLKSPSVAKVDCEETCSLSEHDQTDKIFSRAEEVSENRKQQQKDQENETGSGENEGMGKTKGIAEKGNDSLDDVNNIGTDSLKTEIEEPAPKVGGESDKEERNIDQHVQIVDDQQTFVEENPESIKEATTGSKEDKTKTEEDTESESTKQFAVIIEATLSQNKEALYHDLNSAEDSLDKAVTEVCDRESIDKNFSAKTTHIEEELEETNFKVEENESEKPFNTVVTEKGSEAVGANENERKEKREVDQTPCDGFKDDSMSILKPNPDIENDETILEIGEGAKGTVDGPPLIHIEAKTTIKDEIEDKNNLDTPFIQKTEEICCQKVENPVIFEGLSEIGSGDAKSPQEEHQAEILENITQATANEKFKDEEIDEQKESIMSQIQVQAMTPEALAGEKRIEEKFIVQDEENISNTESVEVKDHLKKGKSEHEEGPEQTFLQHDEPEEEKHERYLDVTPEINDSVASSENVETITCVQDEISKKRLEESLDKRGMEEKPTNTVEISEPRVPKEKNFPLLDSNEVIERAEVEIPKEDEIDFHAKHSILEDTKQVDDEILDKQESSETIIVSTDSTTLQQTFTEGEGMQEKISITSNTEAGKLEKIHGLDYTNKPEVEDAKEKVEDDLQKNDVTFDKETHLKCDDTEAGCIAEDTLVMVHDTTGAGEESSEQSSSELNSKDYTYGAEGNVKSNINKAEEVHDGSRIPAPQEVTEEQIIEGSLNYLSPESIKETAKRFHDDGKEAERSKEEDGKDHIVEEGNFIDQLPHSVAESPDFQDDEKEAGQSKGEIIEDSEEAQACKSFVHETNQDNESSEKDYEGALSAKQEEREQGEVKDAHDSNETGITKEEVIDMLPETSELSERKKSIDSNLNSKESETENEKHKMGYRLETEEELEGNDSKEIIEEVLVYNDPQIAGKDEDSEKHIIQEESTVVVISPQLIGEETSKSSKGDGKEDKQNKEVGEIIETAGGGDEDNKKQSIEEDSLIKDSFKLTTAGDDTRDQIKEEINNFKNQSTMSNEEETLKGSCKEDEEFKIAVSSTDKENQKMDEYDTSDLSSLPVGEKMISECSKECETKAIELEDEVEDSKLELKEQIGAADSIEVPKLETLKDRAETTKNIDAFNSKDRLDAETLPKESNESLVEPFLLPYVVEKETNKYILEKEDPTVNDSEAASVPVVTTALKCSKQTEPEGNKHVEDSDLTSEEKGLATTESKSVMSGSGEINVNVKPEEATNLEVNRDTEILSVVKEAREEVEYSIPDTESEDQTEEIEEQKLMTNNVNTTLDETLSQNKEIPSIAQTPEKMALQTKDEILCLKDDSELASVDFGINSTHEEVAKHSHEELSMPPELSTERYISGSEIMGIIKEEGASEMTNQSEISIVEILKDKDLSNVGGKNARSENEKPLDEASQCTEALSTVTSPEKVIEQGNPAKKFEANLKDVVEEEKIAVELEAEILSPKSGPSDTKETCTLEDENLESECASESVPENLGIKTLTETRGIPINENNSFQYQNMESVEQRITEPEVQECEKKMGEEVDPKLDDENNITGTQSANETRNNVILTEEIPTESEKVDKKENITEQEERNITEHHSVSSGDEIIHEISQIAEKVDKKESSPEQIIVEERGAMEHDIVSGGDEMVDEVENSDLAPPENLQLKEKDSSLQLETVNSGEEPPIEEGDASPITKEPIEAASEIQDNKKHVDFSIQESEASNENAKKGIIEQGDNCSDKLATAFTTVVTEEKILQGHQPNDKPGEGFINVTKESTIQPILNEETCPEDERVDNLKFEATSDSMSKIPAIECENVDKENVSMEKQVTYEIEDTEKASHAVFEDKDQCVKEIHETERSFPMEEPNAKEFEEEIEHEEATMNITDENINIEHSFGTKTAKEICLWNEEPTERVVSKLIEGLHDKQNEPLQEDGDTSNEVSKVVCQEDVSEMSSVDSLSSEKNNELTRSTEHSSQETSKDGEVLNLEGLNKDDDCPTTTKSLGEGLLTEMSEKCKETSYFQCPESGEIEIKEANEAPRIELPFEENQFEGNEGIKTEISNEEITEKTEADKESQQMSISEQTVKEIHQEDELNVEESQREKTKETLRIKENKTQNEELFEEIQKASTSTNIITQITHEDSAKDHDLVVVEHDNESITDDEEKGKNFDEATTELNLQNNIEAINVSEQVTHVSELDMDTAGTNYNKETAITKTEEDPNTNLSVQLATGHEKSQDASETHPTELVHEFEKEIDVSVLNDQESLMESEKHEHASLESASNGIEAKENLKIGQVVSPETETSSVNGITHEEIPDDDRKIREDEKRHDVVFDKHIAAESITADKTAVNDESEHTEPKEPLNELTVKSDRKPDEAEMDNTIYQSKVEPEKPNELFDSRISDIAMLQRGSAADLSGTHETIQNIQKLEETSDYTFGKQILREGDPNEREDKIVATNNKDVPLVVEGTFSKNLEITKEEDLKPKITAMVESEQEAVKCDEKRTDDAEEEKISLSHLLQKSRRETLQMAGQASEVKEPTLAKEEMQTDKEDTLQEEDAKTDEEKYKEEEAGYEHKKDDSCSKDASEMSKVDSSSSEKNNELTRTSEHSSQETPKDAEVLDLEGLNKDDDCPTTTESLGEWMLPEIGEKCEETSYLKEMKETHEAPAVELPNEENQFEGKEDIKTEISNEEIIEKTKADKESQQISRSEETITEIHHEDELIVEEFPGEETKETLRAKENITPNEELSEEIQKGSTSTNIITQITHEDRVARDHDLVFVEHDNESLPDDEEGKNLEEVTHVSELDMDTTGTNYKKETAITKRDEDPNTNLGVQLATGPATEEARHENVGENFEEASETHPRESVHEFKKEIDISVSDDQESLMEYGKHEHTSLESASNGIEVKENLKLGQVVSPETETSSINGITQEEIPDDDRKIREDEKIHDVVFDKHIAVGSITTDGTVVNDESELTKPKEPLKESTMESERKPDEAEMDNTICKSKDETEKPNELLDIQISDIAMLQRGSTADLSGANETTQNIQKLDRTFDYTREKQIPRGVDPNEREETMVATGDKDVQLVVEDRFAKNLEITGVEDLKPEITATVESEQEAVKGDEEKRTRTYDADEEKSSLSHLLQKSGQANEVKEPTLAKEEMQIEKADTFQEEEAKTDEEKYEEDEVGDEHKKDDSGSDAPVMVEASRDMDAKVPHKKHHGILSGVGSKVKHSIIKVKKAITGKSSHSKPLSPK